MTLPACLCLPHRGQQVALRASFVLMNSGWPSSGASVGRGSGQELGPGTGRRRGGGRGVGGERGFSDQ